MSTRTVRKTWRVDGVLTDPSSITLSNEAGTAGVVRNDTGEAVVSDGTAMDKVSTGVYQKSFTEPASGLEYTAYFEVIYGGATYRSEYELDASDPTGGTIISSWGGGTSNCYVSYTAANSFITNSLVNYSAWTAATRAQREAALMESTRQIDARQYIYGKYYSTQLLEFPRMLSPHWSTSGGAWDPNNLSTSQTRMQKDVEQACCHQAVHLLNKNTLSSHTDLLVVGVKGMKRKVGPVEEEYKYGNPSGSRSAHAGGSKQPLCEATWQLLSDWMTSRRIYRS